MAKLGIERALHQAPDRQLPSTEVYRVLLGEGLNRSPISYALSMLRDEGKLELSGLGAHSVYRWVAENRPEPETAQEVEPVAEQPPPKPAASKVHTQAVIVDFLQQHKGQFRRSDLDAYFALRGIETSADAKYSALNALSKKEPPLLRSVGAGVYEPVDKPKPTTQLTPQQQKIVAVFHAFGRPAKGNEIRKRYKELYNIELSGGNLYALLKNPAFARQSGSGRDSSFELRPATAAAKNEVQKALAANA